MKDDRHAFRLGLAVMLLLSTTFSTVFADEASSTTSPPNIILILSDDSGFSDLGCYGGEIETPVLDRLAGSGLRFAQLYSTSRCWPTRAALMTGYYPQQVGMDPIAGTFPSWVVGVPERLAQVGYRPFHVGKWHIRNAEPVEMGFIDPSIIPEAPPGAVAETDGDSEFGFPHSEAYTDLALDFLYDHQSRFSDRPFFLYLAYQAPHFPLRALESDIAAYEERYLAGWDKVHAERAERVAGLGLYSGTVAPMEPTIMSYDRWPDLPERLGPGEVMDYQSWESLNDEQKRFQARKMAIHAAMMTRMDREIGRIVDWLERNSQLENTLIVYLSDNGATAEMMIRKGDTHDPSARPGSQETYLTLGPGWAMVSNSPFRYYKMYTHEGGIASPGIVHWPTGVAGEGRISQTPAHFIDIVATFLELAGLEPGIDGAPPTLARSLLPVLQGTGEPRPMPLYFRHRGKALREGDFKVVAPSRSSDNWKLYDMRGDRAEQNDLSNGFPEQLEAMVDRWNELDARFEADAGM